MINYTSIYSLGISTYVYFQRLVVMRLPLSSLTSRYHSTPAETDLPAQLLNKGANPNTIYGFIHYLHANDLRSNHHIAHPPNLIIKYRWDMFT
jgi:polyferredoxin